MSNCNTPALDSDVEGIRDGASEVYDNNKDPMKSQGAYWELRLIAKIDELRRERDAALARLQIARDAVSGVMLDALPCVDSADPKQFFITEWAMKRVQKAF